MPTGWLATRTARLLDGIDVDRETGLEIGPLASPLVAKLPGRPIYYADYADRATLVHESRNNGHVDLDAIAEVDYLIAPLPPTLDRGFDYICASHVIEHVPDLLGWITTLLRWMRPGGRLVLAAPDKRYCFDALRPLSTTGQVLDAFREQRARPSFGTIYDAFRSAVDLDTARAWREEPYRAPLKPLYEPATALHLANQASDTGIYRDCHCWVFTYSSFLGIMEEVRTLGVADLEVASSAAPVDGSNEFHVVLRAGPGLMPPR